MKTEYQKILEEIFSVALMFAHAESLTRLNETESILEYVLVV